MDNIKKELLDTFDDLINNRVKDLDGNVIKYDDRDREIYVKVFNNIKKSIIYNKDKFDLPSYELLISIIEKVLEIIKNKNI